MSLDLGENYKDLKPLKDHVSDAGQAYTSQNFYVDFFKAFDHFAPKLGISRFKTTFEKLIDQKILIIFFTKGRINVDYGAYYSPISNRIFAPYQGTFESGRYHVDFVKGLSFICHELGHFIMANKPYESLKTFSPLLHVFYRLCFTSFLEKKGAPVNDEVRAMIDEMVDRFLITADQGFKMILAKDLDEFFQEKRAPQQVREKIKDMLDVLEVYTGTSNRKVPFDDLRMIVHVMIAVHTKLSGVSVEDFRKARAGMPIQEFFAPSEAICLQAQINQAVRIKVLSITNTIV